LEKVVMSDFRLPHKKLSDDPRPFPVYFWVFVAVAMVIGLILLFKFLKWFVPWVVPWVHWSHFKKI
jgi:hypothetical protein